MNEAELKLMRAECAIQGVIKACRQFNHSGCNPSVHAFANAILFLLWQYDEVQAEEMDELALRGSAENE